MNEFGFVIGNWEISTSGARDWPIADIVSEDKSHRALLKDWDSIVTLVELVVVGWVNPIVTLTLVLEESGGSSQAEEAS